jgi:hypothetical protein
MALSLAIKESKITITNTIQMMLWLQLPALDSIFLNLQMPLNIKPKTQCDFKYWI